MPPPALCIIARLVSKRVKQWRPPEAKARRSSAARRHEPGAGGRFFRALMASRRAARRRRRWRMTLLAAVASVEVKAYRRAAGQPSIAPCSSSGRPGGPVFSFRVFRGGGRGRLCRSEHLIRRPPHRPSLRYQRHRWRSASWRRQKLRGAVALDILALIGSCEGQRVFRRLPRFASKRHHLLAP